MLAARRMMLQPSVGIPPPTWRNTAGSQEVNSTSTSHSGTSFTPSANTLILVTATWLDASGGAGTPPTTGISDTIGGLTWTEITNGWHTQTLFGTITDGAKSSIFWAITGSSPPAGTITTTSSSATSKHFEVIEVPGANLSSPIGTTGFGNASGTNGGSAQNLTATTTGTPAVNSCMIAMLGSTVTNSAPGGVTDDSSYTNLFDAGSGSANTAYIDCAYELTGDNSVTWSVGANSSQYWFLDGILVEIKAP